MSTVKSGGDNSSPQSSETTNDTSVKLTFGVFFDGTLNSIANIDERKNFQTYLSTHSSTDATDKRNKYYKKNDSYTNEYTNVARFYKCFNNEEDKFIFPIYVEGIGTKPRELNPKIDTDKLFEKAPIDYGTNSSQEYYDGKISREDFIKKNYGFISCSDDTLGSALGIGLFGVKKKVESACEKIFKKLNDIKKLTNYKEAKIELYVFGFSRGSAAARCFSACLKQRLGKTNVKTTLSSIALSSTNLTIVRNKLNKENEYKTSLKADWLDEFFQNKNISLKEVKVNFLGLYDTVSSYGVDFYDDVNELSLKINDNVNKTFQICAGDEYRKNFALTDITSAQNGDFTIIPGAHSDIGGGYSHNIVESLKTYIIFSSGHKGENLLLKEGWFELVEQERTISNLYSIIPFLLMKEKIEGLNTAFQEINIEKYKLPESGSLTIDEIEHPYSKELCDFYNNIKAYKYAIENKTINFKAIEKSNNVDNKALNELQKKEDKLTNEVLNKSLELEFYKNINDEDSFFMNKYENIARLKEEISNTSQDLYNVKKQKCQYDNEQLLKIIRHEFLHLSAKTTGWKDFFANGADKNNKRTVIDG